MTCRAHRHGWFLALAVLLWLAACTPTPPPTPTATPGTAPEIINDSFSTASDAWALFDAPESAATVQQGELYLEDRGRGIGVYTQLLGRSFRDVILKVKVRHIEGTQDNWMGAICRQQDEENYTLFAISADGYYLILKVENGSPTPLVEPTPADVIHTGRDHNTLEVRCEGPALTLIINDTLTVSTTDESILEGGVALFTDAVRGGTTTTAFDDFALLQP